MIRTALALLALLLLLPGTAPARNPLDAAVGEALERQVHATIAPPWREPGLVALVNRVGQRLAAETEEAGEVWRFAILDSASANAFALPGGRILLTRGLLVLMNDEAELAAVLAHEIGHIVLAHAEERQAEDGFDRLGLLGGLLARGDLTAESRARLAVRLAGIGGALLSVRYTRAQELEADAFGIDLMARAGYDPFAAPDVMAASIAEAALSARLSGQDYNPARVGLLESHPAAGDRLLRARQAALAARQAHPLALARGRNAFLSALEGVVYGDSAEQGFLRGRSFYHPVLGIRLDLPPGWAVTNSPTALSATAPDGARLGLDAGPDLPGPLDRYIAETLLPGLGRLAPLGPPFGLRALRINGIEAAQVLVPIRLAAGPGTARITAFRRPGLILRVTGIAPNRLTARQDELRLAAESLRLMTPAERQGIRPHRLDIRRYVPVRRAEELGEDMAPGPEPRARFEALNGLSVRPLRPGDLYKVVTE